ncbi:hypothetical protein [Streptomyces sp. NPDC006193]|uniref:hypothetical protein n=1 Tax=Streptomyces sp. NPDC006193 TaxID=3155717 RepID=UPI0033B92273
MDFNTLYHANFKLLDDAVSDWSTLVKHLADLKKDAEDHLHKAAVKADWAGVNAQVSKQFVGKTAGEFGDAHTQATTIYRILLDTRDELKLYHRQLTDAVSRGQKKNLTVIDRGDGAFQVMGSTRPDWASDPSGKTGATDQKDVDALRDEIQGILSKATESDSTARDVLVAIADQTRTGFSDAHYKDRDTAAAAVKEADELAKLARKDPDDLTVEEFDRVNAGLKKYHDDPLFAERFTARLGAKRTLEFWAGVTDPMVAPDLTRERREQFDELQKSLGLTLATASRSDTPSMTRWKQDVIELGDRPIGHRADVLGVQVMSNLMRVGDYDDAFLTAYGKRLMATERKFTHDGAHTGWQQLPTNPYLNRMSGDTGWDPLSGYLKGLSNNPAAATDFFNDDFIPKDGDHKHAVSNFKYLFEDRHWPQAIKSDISGDWSHDGRNNLAAALEAATTGHPAGELPTDDTPAHNAGQVKLFESIVSSISDDNARLTDHGYMADSIGQIASEYLPDIDRATTDVDPHPDKGDADGQAAWDRVQKLYPVQGTGAELDRREATRFLFAVGQDPKGYAAVEVGQKAYMGRLMEYHLNPDLPAEQRPNQDVELAIRDIARHSGQVSGTLAMGRNEAVAGPADAKDKDFDHSVAQWKNLLSGTVGTGVGVGTSFIASPAVGAGVGGVAGTATSMMLEELFKDAEGSAKDDAGTEMGKNWQLGNENNIKYTRKAAYNAARAYHLSNTGDVSTWAEDSSSQGFMEGGNYMKQVGPELVTDI